MNEFYCTVCNAPGSDTLGHFRNQIEDHRFISYQRVTLITVCHTLSWIYGKAIR